MNHTLHDLQLMGIRPIITHPERNAILQGQPGRLAAWVQIGCFGQVTAGSLTGGFGPKAQEDALHWIGEGLIHFVASDAHNMTWRPLTLLPATVCPVVMSNQVTENFWGLAERSTVARPPEGK